MTLQGEKSSENAGKQRHKYSVVSQISSYHCVYLSVPGFLTDCSGKPHNEPRQADSGRLKQGKDKLFSLRITLCTGTQL